MDYLSWDLAILSRAVAFANLSSASTHVGLSQPQLSRIVAKLEDDLGVVLLDRETRRKSSWTPAAFRLAEIYGRVYRSFRNELDSLALGQEPTHYRLGTLEGLVPQALELAGGLLKQPAVMVLELDVLDQNFLEERFQRGDLDLMLTMREPGRKKHCYVKQLGFQTIESTGKGEPHVFSSFEYVSTAHKRKPTAKAFVSNSLRVREEWLARFGGSGTLPSPLRAKRSGRKSDVEVMLLGRDGLPLKVWQAIQSLLGDSD